MNTFFLYYVQVEARGSEVKCDPAYLLSTTSLRKISTMSASATFNASAVWVNKWKASGSVGTSYQLCAEPEQFNGSTMICKASIEMKGNN